MTTFEMLERWAQYTKFDPGQTRFNLLTSEFTLNRCNKRIQELLTNYDPSAPWQSCMRKTSAGSYSRRKSDTVRSPDGDG